MKNLSPCFLFGMILAFGLSGCTSDAPVSPRLDSSETSLFEHISSKEKSQSIVYLYRPFKFYSGGATPWVTVDGYKTVLLGNNQYTRLVVRPGYHMIQTEQSDNWISGQLDTLHFSVERGKIYFLKISLLLEWHLENLWLILCTSCSIVDDISKIEKIEKSIALPELKKTTFVPHL